MDSPNTDCAREDRTNADDVLVAELLSECLTTLEGDYTAAEDILVEVDVPELFVVNEDGDEVLNGEIILPSEISDPHLTALLENVEAIIPPVDSGITPEVHNVVCTVEVGGELDLIRIALNLRNAEYNPRKFNGVIMRIDDPKSTALIFKSGKLIVTGARNESDANLATRKYCRILQLLGFDIKFINYTVQNLIASADMKFPIQIEDLYTNHYQFCSYEPELFPGVIYRMVRPKMTVLIFVSGKVVLMGAKTREDLKIAFENIYNVAEMYKK